MIEQKRSRILKLNAKNWSTRDIAAAVNESTGEVSKLLKECGAVKDKRKRSPTGNTYTEDIALMMRKFERCKSCGGKVQLPCMQCEMTAKKVSPPSSGAPVTENGSVI